MEEFGFRVYDIENIITGTEKRRPNFQAGMRIEYLVSLVSGGFFGRSTGFKNKKGFIVGIVGPSGSGKSFIAERLLLLSRDSAAFFDAFNGSIAPLLSCRAEKVIEKTGSSVPITQEEIRNVFRTGYGVCRHSENILFMARAMIYRFGLSDMDRFTHDVIDLLPDSVFIKYGVRRHSGGYTDICSSEDITDRFSELLETAICVAVDGLKVIVENFNSGKLLTRDLSVVEKILSLSSVIAMKDNYRNVLIVDNAHHLSGSQRLIIRKLVDSGIKTLLLGNGFLDPNPKRSFECDYVIYNINNKDGLACDSYNFLMWLHNYCAGTYRRADKKKALQYSDFTDPCLPVVEDFLPECVYIYPDWASLFHGLFDSYISNRPFDKNSVRVIGVNNGIFNMFSDLKICVSERTGLSLLIKNYFPYRGADEKSGDLDVGRIYESVFGSEDPVFNPGTGWGRMVSPAIARGFVEYVSRVINRPERSGTVKTAMVTVDHIDSNRFGYGDGVSIAIAGTGWLRVNPYSVFNLAAAGYPYCKNSDFKTVFGCNIMNIGERFVTEDWEEVSDEI